MQLVVIWDLDGTLVVSDAMEDAWFATLTDHHVDLTAARALWRDGYGRALYDQLLDMGIDDDRAAVINEAFWDRWDGEIRSQLLDGAHDALAALHRAGAVQLLSTGSNTRTARALMDHYGLTRYFLHVQGSEPDCRKGPDHYRLFAELVGHAPDDDEALWAVVGDGHWDHRYAIEHNVPVRVGLFGRDDQLSVETLLAEGATHVVNDLRLVPEVLLDAAR